MAQPKYLNARQPLQAARAAFQTAGFDSDWFDQLTVDVTQAADSSDQLLHDPNGFDIGCRQHRALGTLLTMSVAELLDQRDRWCPSCVHHEWTYALQRTHSEFLVGSLIITLNESVASLRLAVDKSNVKALPKRRRAVETCIDTVDNHITRGSSERAVTLGRQAIRDARDILGVSDVDNIGMVLDTVAKETGVAQIDPTIDMLIAGDFGRAPDIVKPAVRHYALDSRQTLLACPTQVAMWIVRRGLSQNASVRFDAVNIATINPDQREAILDIVASIYDRRSSVAELVRTARDIVELDAAS